MSVDIVEMLWECTHCKETNLGRHKECQSCGKTKSEKCREWLPDDVSAESSFVVKDESMLHKFQAGADWKCKYCDSLEWKVDGSCANCGASQDEKGELKKLELESKPEPPTTESAVRRKAPRKRSVQRPAAPPAPAPSYDCEIDAFNRTDRQSRRNVAAGAISAVGLGAIALYLIFHTVTHPAVVSSTSWTHTVHVERNQVMHHDGWSPPGDAFNVHNEGRKLHHYDHVVDHYDTEQYTYQEACGQNCVSIPRVCTSIPRTCTSNRNGSATCSGGGQSCSGGGQSCSTRYCSRTGSRQVARYRDDPVYRDYYDWDVWEWVFNRNVTASGSDVNPHPPTNEQINLGPKERASETVTLNVVFTDDDDHKAHEYTPKSLGEFQTLTVGARRTIKVNALGSVELSPTK